MGTPTGPKTLRFESLGSRGQCLPPQQSVRSAFPVSVPRERTNGLPDGTALPAGTTVAMMTAHRPPPSPRLSELKIDGELQLPRNARLVTRRESRKRRTLGAVELVQSNDIRMVE